MKLVETTRTLTWGGVETMVIERRGAIYQSTKSTFYPASGRTIVSTPHYFTMRNGVPRWENGVIPYLSDIKAEGIDATPGFDEKRTVELRERYDALIIRRYRERYMYRELTAEEKAEMRAEFGEGAAVVDVLSGQRFRT